MCAECLRKLVTLALVFASVDAVVGTEATHPPEGAQDRAPQQKGRMSLQNSAEIQHCLVSAGDVGCSVFECFENNSCEIRGLHEICMTFLHNAGKFDAQGKSFIKDALRCKAHALRHKFSCISRKCPAIKEMVFQLQRECYQKHDLCSAAKENVQVIVEMIHFKDLLQLEPYVDLVNILLTCGEEVKEAITQSVQTQYRLLVHHFRTGLDIDLRRACVVRGIVGRLSEWFKAVVELNVGLRELPGAREVRLQPRKGQDQSKDSTNQMPSSNARPKPVFRCFRCNRPGHRAAECTFPESTNIPTGVGRPGTTPKKMTEKSRVAHQVGQTAPGDISPALEEYEEEGPVEDPM
ncbi:stanniocalcin-2 [Crotalus adamanteus]|uniref:Stanniocalcin-2 n=1 Tax=Crotalus adamanteus TaxID=8729 RepID=A0AAW1BWU1_CROAD